MGKKAFLSICCQIASCRAFDGLNMSINECVNLFIVSGNSNELCTINPTTEFVDQLISAKWKLLKEER